MSNFKKSTKVRKGMVEELETIKKGKPLEISKTAQNLSGKEVSI